LEKENTFNEFGMLNALAAINPNNSTVFLSQATQLTNFTRGKFNFIFANVGAGKTTYIGKELPKKIQYTGAFIFLAPYKSLKQQTINQGLFDKENESFRKELRGFTIFEVNNKQPLQLNDNSKVAMTTQAFFHYSQKHPEVWDKIGVLIIDEVDHVLLTLPKWGKIKNDPFKSIESTLLQHMHKFYLIGITATNKSKLLDMWGDNGQEIKFKESLRELNVASEHKYSDLLEVLSALQHQHKTNPTKFPIGKIAIFIKQIKIAKFYKNLLQQKGYSVDLLVSDSAENYSMTMREKRLKRAIEATGKGDFSDILIFNATLERGVSIYDQSFTHVFVHDSNEVTQIQVLGRFRFSGIHAYLLFNKAEKAKVSYKLPKEFYEKYIGRKLFTADKKHLEELLNWKNIDNNRLVKFPGICKILQTHYNFNVTSGREVVNGKRESYSYITVRVTI